MVDKQLGGAGLRGQSAGDTALCTVGKSGTGLTYRGYDITDLAENATFEVAWNSQWPSECKDKYPVDSITKWGIRTNKRSQNGFSGVNVVMVMVMVRPRGMVPGLGLTS